MAIVIGKRTHWYRRNTIIDGKNSGGAHKNIEWCPVYRINVILRPT
jgi:hypothetical protein